MQRVIPFLVLVGALALPLAAQAEESCHVTGTMMSRAAMKQSLESRGYTHIRGLFEHNGCYEAKGFNNKGQRFEIEVNGVTGAIRHAE